MVRTDENRQDVRRGSKVGYFDSEEAAAIAYNTAATDHFGAFSCINALRD